MLSSVEAIKSKIEHDIINAYVTNVHTCKSINDLELHSLKMI